MGRENFKLYLLLFILIAGPFSLKGQHEKNYSLLWRIEGNGLRNPSYLFGTMHVKDARAFNFSDSVFLAIQKTDFFALELQPDSMMNNIFNKYFEDDKTFKRLFDDNEYRTLNERLKKEKGFDLDKINIKNPIIIRSLLTPSVSKPDDKQTFVDAYLYGIAKTSRKTVFGLEKVKDQTDIFYGASKKEQKQELMEVLENSSAHYLKSLNYMTDVYSRGNIEEIQRMVEHLDLIDSIMIRRNSVMTNSLKELMHKAPTFAAVGCAHLPGENGVIHMLRKEGYTVSKVEASFTGIADRFKIDPLKMKWYDYKDDKLGYALKMPGKPIPADIFPGLNMMMYPDLISESNFFVMTIDLRGASKLVKEEDMAKKMIEGFKEKGYFEVIKKRKMSRNGLGVTEITGKTNNEYITLNIAVSHNIVYCLYMSHKGDKPDKAYADYFFNSLRTYEPQRPVAEEWHTYTNKGAAFSASFPFEPKETKKTYRENNATVNLVMAADLRNMSNYMVAYNDYPLGYYLDDQQEVFQSLVDEYSTSGKLLSSPDTIWLEGVEGREYEVMLADKYYTICRVYIRGNRVYKVLHQNLNEGETRLREDGFLKSFSFVPFENEELEEHTPEGEDFKLMLFPQWQVTVDSAIDHSWYTSTTTTYILKDSQTGGVYSLEFSDLKDYFKTTHLDTFYTKIIDDNILGWTDSLVSSKNVEMSGVTAKEVVAMNIYSKQKKRYRFWLDDKKLFYMAAYVAEEAMFNKASNTFFESYVSAQETSTFDYFASKADKIIKGLSASDSSVYNASIGAFNYYEFADEDLPLIYKALQAAYADDSAAAGSRCRLIEELANIGNRNSLEFMKKLYEDATVTETIKSSILSSAIRFKDKVGYELFLDLFLNQPPAQMGNKDWAIFRPFSDSLSLARQHFDKLLSFMDNEEYRSNVLSLASQMATSDSTADVTFVESVYPELTRFAFEDLENYLTTIDTDTSEYIYFYDEKIAQYLRLANNIKSKSFIDEFTSKVLSSKITGWMKTQAITARIFNNLQTDDDQVSELLASMETRYTVMESMAKADKVNEIPKKYRDQEEFAKTCFYEALNYDDEAPDEIEVLGYITVDGSRVYVFSFWYDYDEEYKYIGLSGFYPQENDTLNFDEHLSYSPWEYLEKDWEKQAQLYVADLKEYGY